MYLNSAEILLLTSGSLLDETQENESFVLFERNVIGEQNWTVTGSCGTNLIRTFSATLHPIAAKFKVNLINQRSQVDDG